MISFFNVAEYSQLEVPFWLEPVKFYQVHPAGIFHARGKIDLEDEGNLAFNRQRYIEFLFFDLWHFFASMKTNSLAAVAESLGLKKLDFDVTNLKLSILKSRRFPEFKKYAMNDAKLMVQIFNILYDTYMDINKVSIITRSTPASASMASFKKVYLKTTVRPTRMDIRRLALRSDWGGRVECGFVGETNNVHEFDADSLYPRSTLLFKGLPDSRDWKYGTPTDFEGTEGFIDFSFKFPREEEWPCIPVWQNSIIYFPLEGRSVCTISEFKVGLSRGMQCKRVFKCCYFTDGSRTEFQRFIMDNIKLKEANEDNPAIRAVAKLNMNSVIGKLIQNKGGLDYDEIGDYVEKHWDQLIDEEIEELYAGTFEPDRFRRKAILGAGFYPEWHSLILGKSRSVVADAIYNAPDYPRILMVSTDSMHTPTNRIGSTMVRFNHQVGPVYFKAVRCRVHVAKDMKTGKIVKLAKHAMPIPFDEAANLILTATKKTVVNVKFKGMKTLREAILSHDQIGASKNREMRIDFKPDRKRRLDDRGWTHPLAV